MRISLISAMARNHVIGDSGELPWNLPDDYTHFLKTTDNHTIIMGRRTYESMDRPLPNRRNIVLTTSSAFHPEGVEVTRDLEQALSLAASNAEESETFIIGGSAVYEAALPIADRIYLTLVDAELQGDTFFPPFDWEDWRITHKQPHPADSRHEYAFEILTLDRQISV